MFNSGVNASRQVNKIIKLIQKQINLDIVTKTKTLGKKGDSNRVQQWIGVGVIP